MARTKQLPRRNFSILSFTIFNIILATVSALNAPDCSAINNAVVDDKTGIFVCVCDEGYMAASDLGGGNITSSLLCSGSSATPNNATACMLAYASPTDSPVWSGSCEAEDECSAEEITSYDQPMHIGAIFITMVASLAGGLLPLMKLSWMSPVVMNSMKLCGAGVILATGIIHILPEAGAALSNECLPRFFVKDYPNFGYLLCVITMLLLHMLNCFLAKRSHMHCHHIPTKDIYLPTKDIGKLDESAMSSRVAAYLLEVGIAIHSVIIGIELGMETTNFKVLLIAICFHQFLEGFALTCVVLDGKYESLKVPITTAICYSLSEPTGVAIGVGIRATFNGNDPSTLIGMGVIDSLASGVLLYSAIVHMLVPASSLQNDTWANSSSKQKWMQWLALWLGAASMSIIAIWA